MRRRWILLIPAAVLGILFVAFLGGTVVQQLWNWLLPALFGFRPVTFWQALGLLALCRILFGGSGLLGSSRARVRRRMAERWDRMTPQERERVREGLRRRWRGDPPSAGEAP